MKPPGWCQFEFFPVAAITEELVSQFAPIIFLPYRSPRVFSAVLPRSLLSLACANADEEKAMDQRCYNMRTVACTCVNPSMPTFLSHEASQLEDFETTCFSISYDGGLVAIGNVVGSISLFYLRLRADTAVHHASSSSSTPGSVQISAIPAAVLSAVNFSLVFSLCERMCGGCVCSMCCLLSVVSLFARVL